MAPRRAVVCARPLLIPAEQSPCPLLAGQSPLAAFPPAPGPRSRCPSGAGSVFLRRSESCRSAFPLAGSRSALRASLRKCAVAAPRRPQVCTLPLLVAVSSRTAWPPASPAPGIPRRFVRGAREFRRELPAFRRVALRSSRSLGPARASLRWVTQSQPCGVLRSARDPCPLRQDRAPWPPSLLRQAPKTKVVGLRRLSPGLPGSRRSFHLAVPDPRLGLSTVVTRP
jgi:hypothetical protein